MRLAKSTPGKGLFLDFNSAQWHLSTFWCHLKDSYTLWLFKRKFFVLLNSNLVAPLGEHRDVTHELEVSQYERQIKAVALAKGVSRSRDLAARPRTILLFFNPLIFLRGLGEGKAGKKA